VNEGAPELCPEYGDGYFAAFVCKRSRRLSVRGKVECAPFLETYFGLRSALVVTDAACVERLSSSARASRAIARTTMFQ